MKRTLYTPDRRTVTDNLTEVEDRYLTDEVILRYLVWLQDRIVNVNDLINEDHQSLVVRSGVGYRYTSFSNGNENESSPTLDFGLAHTYKYKDAFSMENDISYVPSFDDFGNYRVVHDSGIEIPVGSGDQWKIRMGVKNEYHSQPAVEKKLDTTYYTRMIYSWD